MLPPAKSNVVVRRIGKKKYDFLILSLNNHWSLLFITWEEQNLDAGRFVKFSKDTLPYFIKIEITLDKMLEIANAHDLGKWSWACDFTSRTYWVSFETEADLVKFRLIL